MGYQFQGVFTKSSTAAATAKDQWPWCQIKQITRQMQGYVVRLPVEYDLHPTATKEQYECVLEQAATIREGLEAFSTQFPDEVFVYVEVECFGGVCGYMGFHVYNGVTTKRFDDPEDRPLFDLLLPMKAALGPNGYFEPFERGYFSLP